MQKEKFKAQNDKLLLASKLSNILL